MLDGRGYSHTEAEIGKLFTAISELKAVVPTDDESQSAIMESVLDFLIPFMGIKNTIIALNGEHKTRTNAANSE